MYKKLTLISLLCLIIDQLTKYIVTIKMNLFDSTNIIKSFFSITYVRNFGAAWSILEGNDLFLIVVAIMSIILIYYYFIKNKVLNNKNILILGTLIGGIMGNLIDRIILGYVVDFLDFTVFNYDFPVFNFADCFIVISIFFLIIEIFKEEQKNAENNSRT